MEEPKNIENLEELLDFFEDIEFDGQELDFNLAKSIAERQYPGSPERQIDALKRTMKSYRERQGMIVKLKKYGSTKEEIKRNLREIVQGNKDLSARYYAYLESERTGRQEVEEMLRRFGYKSTGEISIPTIEEIDRDYLGVLE